MRKQIFSLALSTLFGLGIAMAAPQATTPAQSQDQSTASQNGNRAGRHEADPAKQVQHLAKKLNLTADQQNQILPILQDRQQQMREHRGEHNGQNPGSN